VENKKDFHSVTRVFEIVHLNIKTFKYVLIKEDYGVIVESDENLLRMRT
jgi:hypothetical protein